MKNRHSRSAPICAAIFRLWQTENVQSCANAVAFVGRVGVLGPAFCEEIINAFYKAKLVQVHRVLTARLLNTGPHRSLWLELINVEGGDSADSFATLILHGVIGGRCSNAPNTTPFECLII